MTAAVACVALAQFCAQSVFAQADPSSEMAGATSGAESESPVETEADEEDGARGTTAAQPPRTRTVRAPVIPKLNPNAKWSCSKVELGHEPVWRGAEPPRYDFHITNTGTEKLWIKAEGGCGASYNGRSDRLIGPGKTENLQVRIDCGKLRGEFRRTIQVTTNDPDNQLVKLVCTGKILEPILVEPPHVNMGRMPFAPRPVSTTIEISPGDAGPLDIRMAPNDTRAVQTQLRKGSSPGQYFIDVTVTPPFEADRLSTELVLETGFSEVPTVRIPVRAAMFPRVSTRPKLVRVPAQRAPGWERRVDIIFNDGRSRRLLAVAIDHPDISAAIYEEDGRQFLLLHSATEFASEPGPCELIVSTDDEQLQEFVIPVTVG